MVPILHTGHCVGCRVVMVVPDGVWGGGGMGLAWGFVFPLELIE